MISSISSFEIINVVSYAKSEGRMPITKIVIGIAASVANADVVNPNDIETLFANFLSTFFVKANQFLIMVL